MRVLALPVSASRVFHRSPSAGRWLQSCWKLDTASGQFFFQFPGSGAHSNYAGEDTIRECIKQRGWRGGGRGSRRVYFGSPLAISLSSLCWDGPIRLTPPLAPRLSRFEDASALGGGFVQRLCPGFIQVFRINFPGLSWDFDTYTAHSYIQLCFSI